MAENIGRADSGQTGPCGGNGWRQLMKLPLLPRLLPACWPVCRTQQEQINGGPLARRRGSSLRKHLLTSDRCVGNLKSWNAFRVNLTDVAFFKIEILSSFSSASNASAALCRVLQELKDATILVLRFYRRYKRQPDLTSCCNKVKSGLCKKPKRRLLKMRVVILYFSY